MLHIQVRDLRFSQDKGLIISKNEMLGVESLKDTNSFSSVEGQLVPASCPVSGSGCVSDTGRSRRNLNCHKGS